MWPWDHVAVAYICYSLFARLRGDRPSAVVAAVVVAAAVAPDVIDKPLAWWLAVLPSGRSLGHSAFTATVVVALAAAVQLRTRIRGLTAAVAIGWGSHLVGDVAYPLVVKGDLRVGFLLWPVVPAVDDPSPDAVGHLSELFAAFVEYLATPAGATYLLLDVTLLLTAVVLWVADGAPGTEFFRPRPDVDADPGER